MDQPTRRSIRAQRLRRQLTTGCNRRPCPNPLCTSHDPSQILSEEVIQSMIKSHLDEDCFCPLINLLPKSIDADVFFEFQEYCEEENDFSVHVEIITRSLSDLSTALELFTTVDALNLAPISTLDTLDDILVLPHRSISNSPHSSHTHFPTRSSIESPTPSRFPLPTQRVNLEVAVRLYKVLFEHKSDALLAALCEKTDFLISEVTPIASLLNSNSDILAVLLVMLLNPLFDDYSYKDSLVALCRIFTKLDKSAVNAVQNWLSLIAFPILQKMLGPLQSFVSISVLMNDLGSLDVNDRGQPIPQSPERIAAFAEVESVLFVMRMLFNAMNQTRRAFFPFSTSLESPSSFSGPKSVPPTTFFYSIFYNDAVNELSMKRQYLRMKQNKFSFISHPYLLLPQSKTAVLRLETHQQQNSQMSQHLFESIFFGRGSLSCILKVRRENIVEDTLNQIDRREPSDLRKPLKIVFVGEEAIDEGGVRKEFFLLLTRELFNLKYGVVKPVGSADVTADGSSMSNSTNSQYYWFNPDFVDISGESKLIGMLLGIAIYNGILLDLHFPTACYKKLLNQPVTLDDVIEMEPQVGQSLKALLDMDAEDIEDCSLTFSMDHTSFGENVTMDFIPNGRNIPVSIENRVQYIACYVDALLNKSIEKVFSSFSHGFSLIMGDLLQMFQSIELEEAVCGTRELDFDELEKVTMYDGGFSKDHPAIRMFWSIAKEFKEEEKRHLLHFVTSCDRAPVGGLSNCRFVIVRNGGDSEQLPTSHTCFNALMLPEYSSREKMKLKLLTAINNAEGFGMK
ncbi:putative Ubiquitin-protein ligase E3A [Blattamonas nauphoetae]|uniref:HECT-type E3 ubiquitin transferase n=1 Tax=Blattamonas nauphoetae TaxID=2049346 RepID=A0ABQ9YER5_9EUKA|nr:putative Ubiquitin-protein ligase E3A [Blattamonas nauphoetae]